jgi:hypothetical protein
MAELSVAPVYSPTANRKFWDRRVALLVGLHLIAWLGLSFGGTWVPGSRPWPLRAVAPALISAQIGLIALWASLATAPIAQRWVLAVCGLTLVAGAFAVYVQLAQVLLLFAFVWMVALVFAVPAQLLRLGGGRITLSIDRRRGAPSRSRFALLDLVGSLTWAAVAAALWRPLSGMQPHPLLVFFGVAAASTLTVAATLAGRKPIVQAVNVLILAFLMGSVGAAFDPAAAAFTPTLAAILTATLLPARLWGYRLVRWRGRPPLEME